MFNKITVFKERRKLVKLILAHFDTAYYLSTYTGVKEKGIAPVEHYLKIGSKEGYDPAPWFSTLYYLESNADVAGSGINPFYHYLKWGKAEGRQPSSFPHLQSGQQMSGHRHPLSHYFQLHELWLEDQKTIDEYCTPATNLFGGQFVAIIGELSLAQCKKYRVMQKLEALSRLGIRANYSHWGDEPRSINLLQLATIAIFYRMPQTTQTEFCFREARRLGLPIIFDIDDPIFDKPTYQQNVNLDFLKTEEKDHLLEQCDGYVDFLRESDMVMVSTPAMKTLVESHVDVPVKIWRNVLDQEALHPAKRINALPRLREDDGRIVIGYMSGSRAHEADFRVVENVLAELLEQNEHVHFKVVGHLNLPGSLKPFEDRITQIPFSGYEEYLNQLSTVDICIIPLTIDGFNACKSAIRYLEASLVKVPSIVSMVGDFVNVMNVPAGGFLVEDEEEWRAALNALVGDKKMRKEMAAAAHKNVMKTQTVAAQAAHVDALVRAMAAVHEASS